MLLERIKLRNTKIIYFILPKDIIIFEELNMQDLHNFLIQVFWLFLFFSRLISFLAPSENNMETNFPQMEWMKSKYSPLFGKMYRLENHHCNVRIIYLITEMKLELTDLRLDYLNVWFGDCFRKVFLRSFKPEMRHLVKKKSIGKQSYWIGLFRVYLFFVKKSLQRQVK